MSFWTSFPNLYNTRKTINVQPRLPLRTERGKTALCSRADLGRMRFYYFIFITVPRFIHTFLQTVKPAQPQHRLSLQQSPRERKHERVRARVHRRERERMRERIIMQCTCSMCVGKTRACCESFVLKQLSFHRGSEPVLSRCSL